MAKYTKDQIEAAAEYVSMSHEAEGEQRAEFGMGAQSMGWDGNEWMAAYDGYRCADDPIYAEAAALLAEVNAERRVREAVPVLVPCGDDIPF